MPITRRILLAAPFAGAASTALAAATATAPAQPEPLTFGALFPLSGSLALLGDESFRGLDLAADAVNAAGGLLGHPVALARGDASDAAPAAAEAKRLIEQAKAAMLFGSFSSAVSLSASAVAEVAAVPFVELDALADSITERGFKLLFRTGLTASACGAAAVEVVPDLLAKLWQTDPGTLKIALLFEDGPDGSGLAAAMEARLKQFGLPLNERISYSAAAPDLAPIALRLRGAAVDVLLHAGLPNDVVALHRALQQVAWKPRMVVGTGGGYALADTAQALGAALDGAISVGGAPYRISDIAAPGAAEVAAAYQRKYGAPPRSGHSLASYAGAAAVFGAIQRTGSLDRDKLRAALLATVLPAGSTPGGNGVQFDEHGQNTLATPYVAQWQGGALLTVAPRPAAVAAVVG